ncbi:MAG: AraC family transcriptional regulator [Clostridia bacterium]|nr:AraC family transcriptional regulator [Clostridia bacterium]
MSIREEYRLNSKRLVGLNPITYGQQKCVGNFSVDVPRPYWLLHYVVSGKGTFNTGGASYTVSPSQIFVVRPHQKHSYIANENNPWHYIWVAFESDIALPHILSTDVFTAPAAGKIFSDILSAAKIEFGKEEYISGKVWELMSLLIQLESGMAEIQSPYVNAAKEYISENYMRGIKVTDIAKSLNLDRSYFSTVFKKQTGMSPQQYLCEYRLERAAELLSRGEDSVTEAAYHSGYGDIVNFSRMFKKHFGTAPSKYRDMILMHEGEI